MVIPFAKYNILYKLVIGLEQMCCNIQMFVCFCNIHQYIFCNQTSVFLIKSKVYTNFM